MTLATKHTPGPWSLHYGSTKLNGAQVRGSDGVHIASISRKADKPIDQKLADAHLIIAAPDLLGALRRAYEWLSTSGMEATPEQIEEECAAAILKAEHGINSE